MKRSFAVTVFCVITSCGFTQDLGVGLDFLLEAYPVGSLISPEAEGFRVQGAGESGEVESPFNSIPSIRLGLGLETPIAFVDATIGGGPLLNGFIGDYALVGGMVRGDLALRIKLGKLVTLGPRVGLTYFGEPEWIEDGDVELSDSLGAAAGLGLTVGMKLVSFSFSLEYLTNSFDVEDAGSFFVNDDELDISGVALHFGVLCRF